MTLPLGHKYTLAFKEQLKLIEVVNMNAPHTFIRTSLCTFLLLIFCTYASAKTALIEHAITVSQSMSSFYMYNLSEGDSRYKHDYEELLIKADNTLEIYEQEDVMGAANIKKRWQTLRPLLDYEQYDNSDYFVPGAIRVQYRNYLNTIYEKVTLSYSNEAPLEQKLALMAFNMEIISARFFDISSSLYGAQSLSSIDRRMNPDKISKQLKQNFKSMKKAINDKSLKKEIASIENKWRFIERTVINYDEESAYLLVYYNKRKINKLINHSQKILLASIN